MPTTATTRPSKKQKEVNVLEAGLRALDDNQLACRDMRHAWAVEEKYHEVPGQSVGRRVPVLKRVLVCMRGCETRRVEHYLAGRYGLDKISQHYEYPTGYQIPGVPRGVKASTIVQQEAYRRHMELVANIERGNRARTKS